MRPIVVKLSRQRKRLLMRAFHKPNDWRSKRNILLVLAAAAGETPATIARLLQLAPCSVGRIKRRFLQKGLQGIKDGRTLRGPLKATREVAEVLFELVRASPQDYGLCRPTWTRALLAEQIHTETGVRLSVSTVGRLLARIGARWNRARPVVKCPWPEDKRKERLREIGKILARLPPDQIALFQDEVDIHLNPKIGFDWMIRGQQKQVLTPGQNAKRYLAGALEPASGGLVWVSGERKDSALFICLLRRLALSYGEFKRIHLIVDNYCTHKSKATRQALEKLRGTIQLHFLPPYCPQGNKIELVWLHFHRNVTCNHRCQSIEQLMQRSEHYLTDRSGAASAVHQSASGAYRAAA